MSFLKRFALFAAPLGAVAVIYTATRPAPKRASPVLTGPCAVAPPAPTVGPCGGVRKCANGYGAVFHMMGACKPQVHPAPFKLDRTRIDEMLSQQPQYRYCHFESFYRNVHTVDARVALFNLLLALAHPAFGSRPVMCQADFHRALDQVYKDLESTARYSTVAEWNDIHRRYFEFKN